MNAIVDTSVWSRALRRKRQDLSATEGVLIGELTELIREGRSRIIGPVRQELLSGIKSPSQFDKLRHRLQAFTDEPLATSDYEAAAEAGNQCRAQGIAVSSVDILICAVALTRQWSVFTTDPDFRNYARVLPLHLHSPRG